MEGNIFKRLDALNINSEQINFSLIYQEKLLNDIYREEKISESTRQKLEEIITLHKKASGVRQELNQAISEVIQKYKEETIADFGIIYANIHKNILLSMLQFLNDIATKHRVNIICFKLEDLDIEANHVKGIFISSNGVKDITSKVPQLIYNMGYYTKLDNCRKIKKLRTQKEVTVINPINRLNQYIIREMISDLCEETSVLLPYTIFNKNNLYDYLEKYHLIYLLPEKQGDKKICAKIEKDNVNYNLYIDTDKKTFSKEALYEYIIKMIKKQRYFLMQGANPITVNNVPMEVRLYLQRGDRENWDVTQMILKPGGFSGNTPDKGACYLLQEVLDQSMPIKSQKILGNLKKDSLNICAYLENYLNNMANCFFDFIITENGKHYLMYFGGCEDKQYPICLGNGKYWREYFATSIDHLIYLKSIR